MDAEPFNIKQPLQQSLLLIVLCVVGDKIELYSLHEDTISFLVMSAIADSGNVGRASRGVDYNPVQHIYSDTISEVLYAEWRKL